MSCTTSKVITDYDAKSNFTQFTTYNFYSDIGKGLNEFDVKRVIKSLNFELQEKGFIESENPDFYINVISEHTKTQNNTIGIGIGSGNNNGGFNISGGIPIGGEKIQEKFIIEFVNAKTNEIIWEGVLNSIIRVNRKPEIKEAHFYDIIHKIVSKYPPKL